MVLVSAPLRPTGATVCSSDEKLAGTPSSSGMSGGRSMISKTRCAEEPARMTVFSGPVRPLIILFHMFQCSLKVLNFPTAQLVGMFLFSEAWPGSDTSS